MARRSRLRGATLAALVACASLLASTATAVPLRDPIWVSTYAPAHAGTETAIAIDPSGATLYVGGAVQSSPRGLVIAAYASGTGERRWLTEYPCSDDPDHECWLPSLAVSPDGNTVFVAGRIGGNDRTSDWVTMALDAATGAERWASRSPNAARCCSKLVMAPAGDRVFVAGNVGARGLSERVLAYDAITGGRLWHRKIPGYGAMEAVGVGPDGRRLYLALGSSGGDLQTFALDAATGATMWSRRFGSGRAWDLASSLAVDPLGKRIYVTDYRRPNHESIYVWPITLAYRTSGGKLLWKAVERGIETSSSYVAVAATAERVFVGGGYGVVSHAARNGHTQWGTGTDPYGFDWYNFGTAGLAVSPAGDRVFVVESFENTYATRTRLVTVALTTSTGAVRWYGERKGTNGGGRIVVGPGGARVYVLGSVNGGLGADTSRGIVTMAYRA
jgi:DNA-binding beta-propeller fold protein YncE